MRKKILYVSAAAERGGLEVVLLNILKCLDRSLFTPHVLFLTNGPFVKEVEATETQTHLIDAGRVRQIIRGSRAVVRTARLIRNEGIHLVHSHNAKAHIYGGLAAAIAGIPSIYHLHGVPRLAPTRDGFVSLLSVAVPASRTVACSTYVAGAFTRAWQARREVVVVHNGTVPRVPLAQEVPTVRQEFGIPDDVPLVVMATRLQHWKGVHIFLDAAAHLARFSPTPRFMVVGGTLFGLEESYAVQLSRQVESLNLRKVVDLVGYRPDVFRFYSAADLVVHCSIEPEPFAMVLLEAMACSKPVIASDSGGTHEIVEHEVTGLLVPPKDPERLAKAIRSLLGDPERRVRMGQAGATRVSDYLNANRMTQQLSAMYSEMTGNL